MKDTSFKNIKTKAIQLTNLANAISFIPIQIRNSLHLLRSWMNFISFIPSSSPCIMISGIEINTYSGKYMTILFVKSKIVFILNPKRKTIVKAKAMIKLFGLIFFKTSRNDFKTFTVYEFKFVISRRIIERIL